MAWDKTPEQNSQNTMKFQRIFYKTKGQNRKPQNIKQSNDKNKTKEQLTENKERCLLYEVKYWICCLMFSLGGRVEVSGLIIFIKHHL